MNDLTQKILDIFSGTELSNTEDLWWRTDGEYAPVTFFITCNDVFFWACSDAVTITSDNVDMIKQAADDCETAAKYHRHYGPLLFCARVNEMRPQGAYYEYIPKPLWPLFDACGPVREPDIANPVEHK